MTDSRPTKVLFSTFDVVPDPSGASVRSTAVLESIGTYFDVDALTAKTPNHAHIERYQGARLLRVPVGSGDVRSRAEAFDRAVRRQLQSEEYGVVQFTDPFGGYALCELRPNFGYKLIYDVRGFPSVELRYTDPHLEGDRKFLTKLRRQEIFCLMNADLVLAPCRLTLDHIVSLGVPAEKVHVLPPPVDLERFSVETPIDQSPCRFLYLGSHASWQGLPALLFALRKAAEKSEFSVRIVGPSHGSWRQQLEDTVREFDLRGRVKIEHPVPHDEVPELLEWASVGLAPMMKVDRNTAQGAAPLKIAEYMVAGRPVVASNLALCGDMVEEDLTGLLFPASDEDAMAECLVRIATDLDLRVRMGREARVRGCARYDSRSFRSRLRQVYHLLVSPSAVDGQATFDLGHTPTGRQSPTDPTDPTVTLPAGARPGEPPPAAHPYGEPPTQTSLPLDALPPEPPQEETTGSVSVAEMPWSGGEAEAEAPRREEPDRMDTSPGADVALPDEDESSPPQASLLHGGVNTSSEGGSLGVGAGVAPPDEEETPLPGESLPQAEAPAGGEEEHSMGGEAAVAPPDEDETPLPIEGRLPEDAVPAEGELSDGAQAVLPRGGEAELPSVIVADEPVEIDPDDAILLDEDDAEGVATDASQAVEASPERRLLGPGRLDEKGLEPHLPVIRGVLVGDVSPLPDFGKKPVDRGLKAEEDTNPGFKG